MTKILITGKQSYIGNQFEDWLSQWPDKYQLNKTSLRDNNWKNEDWSQYDVVLHVAGIAHNSSDSNLEELYYQVNRDLTFIVAEKAKREGVPHFIFMSSIIVFGTKVDKIDTGTVPDPDSFYGDSKLQAEKKLAELRNHDFNISIVRPPMVYGKNSKGNFPTLVALAKKTPIFPDFKNQRSMIYIKNLAEFLRQIIENNIFGYLHPQNEDVVQTSELVNLIAIQNQHRIHNTKIANSLIKIFKNNKFLRKVFGNLYYSDEMNDGGVYYQIFDLTASIKDIKSNL